MGVAGGVRRVRSTPLPASPLSRGEEHKRPTLPSLRHSRESGNLSQRSPASFRAPLRHENHLAEDVAGRGAARGLPAVPYFSLPLAGGRVGVGIADGGRGVRSTPLPASPLSRGEERKLQGRGAQTPRPPSLRHSRESGNLFQRSPASFGAALRHEDHLAEDVAGRGAARGLPARPLLLPPPCRGRVGVGVAGGGRRVRSTPLPASPLSREEERKRPTPPSPRHSLE